MPAAKAATVAKRKDPDTINVRGMRSKNLFSIEEGTKDPNRFYVWVPKDGHTAVNEGVRFRRMCGYRVERYRAGGVFPAGMNHAEMDADLKELIEKNAPIEEFGMVLMSISKQERERLEEFNPRTKKGQRTLDEIEEKIIDRQKFRNEMFRGLNHLQRGDVQIGHGARPETTELHEEDL